MILDDKYSAWKNEVTLSFKDNLKLDLKDLPYTELDLFKMYKASLVPSEVVSKHIVDNK